MAFSSVFVVTNSLRLRRFGAREGRPGTEIHVTDSRSTRMTHGYVENKDALVSACTGSRVGARHRADGRGGALLHRHPHADRRRRPALERSVKLLEDHVRHCVADAIAAGDAAEAELETRTCSRPSSASRGRARPSSAASSSSQSVASSTDTVERPLSASAREQAGRGRPRRRSPRGSERHERQRIEHDAASRMVEPTWNASCASANSMDAARSSRPPRSPAAPAPRRPAARFLQTPARCPRPLRRRNRSKSARQPRHGCARRACERSPRPAT